MRTLEQLEKNKALFSRALARAQKEGVLVLDHQGAFGWNKEWKLGNLRVDLHSTGTITLSVPMEGITLASYRFAHTWVRDQGGFKPALQAYNRLCQLVG